MTLRAKIQALINEADAEVKEWDEEHDDENGIGDASYEEWDVRADLLGRIAAYKEVLALLD